MSNFINLNTHPSNPDGIFEASDVEEEHFQKNSVEKEPVRDNYVEEEPVRDDNGEEKLEVPDVPNLPFVHPKVTISYGLSSGVFVLLPNGDMPVTVSVNCQSQQKITTMHFYLRLVDFENPMYFHVFGLLSNAKSPCQVENLGGTLFWRGDDLSYVSPNRYSLKSLKIITVDWKSANDNYKKFFENFSINHPSAALPAIGEPRRQISLAMRLSCQCVYQLVGDAPAVWRVAQPAQTEAFIFKPDPPRALLSVQPQPWARQPPQDQYVAMVTLDRPLIPGYDHLLNARLLVAEAGGDNDAKQMADCLPELVQPDTVRLNFTDKSAQSLLHLGMWHSSNNQRFRLQLSGRSDGDSGNWTLSEYLKPPNRRDRLNRAYSDVDDEIWLAENFE